MSNTTPNPAFAAILDADEKLRQAENLVNVFRTARAEALKAYKAQHGDTLPDGRRIAGGRGDSMRLLPAKASG